MEADKLLVTLLSVWIMVLPSPLSCSWIPSASNDLLTRDDDDKVCCHDENGLYKPRKVQVEFYYETLCPDTRHFIRTQLFPVWQDLKHIMDIHWKPYGKAFHTEDLSTGYSFSCQHGPIECTGNIVHACSIKHVKNDHKLVDYLHCMIEDNYDPKEIGRSCADRHDIDWRPIHACSNSKEGADLLAMHGDDTHSLRPKLTFVPAVIMNGRAIKEDDFMDGFKHILCSAYRGEKPAACLDII